MAFPKGRKRPEFAEKMKGNSYSVGNIGGAGRQSGYKNEYARQAAHLCRLGASNNDLAKFFNVGVEQINSWAMTYKEFAKVVRVGKDESDERVVMSLYNKAIGYEKEITKEIVTKNGEIKTITDKIYVPPSDQAITFWLKNRRKYEWRDRHEHEIGRVGEFEQMSDRELEAYLQGKTLIEHKQEDDVIEGEIFSPEQEDDQ